MGPEVPWSIVGNISVGVLVCALVFWGRLIPKGTVTLWLAMKDEVIKSERTINRVQAEALKHQRATVATLTETNRRLVDEYGKSTAYSLSEIQKYAKEAQESHE